MKRTIGLLALLSAFPPLSTDMYLAAIPLLVKEWRQSLALVNLTLICFFISYCLFLLIYGPVSDRFGRKPPLLVDGHPLYSPASASAARGPLKIDGRPAIFFLEKAMHSFYNDKIDRKKQGDRRTALLRLAAD